MNANEKLAKLRALMDQEGINAYIVDSPDYHQSEYLAEHFKARHFLTGFTGYVGTLVVTKDESALWTDGRYFTQAEIQLKGSEIKLFKMNEPGTPTVLTYIGEKLKESAVLAFDGRTISMGQGINFEKEVVGAKKGKIRQDVDLVDQVWEGRPPMPKGDVFIHDLKYNGESCGSKLGRLREKMRHLGANKHIITTLDDIAWLLNIRGRDVLYVPYTLSYVIVTPGEVELFIDGGKLNAEVKVHLAENNVRLRGYNDIYEAIKTFAKGDCILIDPNRINYSIFANIGKEAKIIEAQNPTVLFKAVKNPVQIENIKSEQVKEGVAFTKFIFWLKNNIGKTPLTEISAAEKLESFRRGQEGYYSPSFPPISGYKGHGAIIHYRPSEETNIELLPESFYLIDSGGQYFGATTDTTRTLALGELTREQKTHYTAVLKANLNLSRLKFLHGCKGSNVDVIARAQMWSLGLDYKHGTGHGIGQFLGGHEAPQRFMWNYPDPASEPVLEAGMILSNEPGFYIKDEYGIRLENAVLVKEIEQNEFGQFLCLEPITYTPFDMDAVDVDALSPADKACLNEYHQKVYDLLAPFLDEAEREWLAGLRA